MIRSPGAAGFDGSLTPVASSRLTHAIAASLGLGALSLCLVVTLTVLSIKVTMAMPIPAYSPSFWLVAFPQDNARCMAPRSDHGEDTCWTCNRRARRSDPAGRNLSDRHQDARRGHHVCVLGGTARSADGRQRTGPSMGAGVPA